MKRWWAVLLLLCLLLSGCSAGNKLELYVLSGDIVSQGMSTAEIGQVALDSGRVVLTGDDLAGVDWERQYYQIKSHASQSVSVIDPSEGGCSLLKTTGSDLFVWVLDGKALYVGGFEKGSSSVSRQREPYIRDRERYVFSIESGGETDLRYNEKLYKFLSKHGLIRSELS